MAQPRTRFTGRRKPVSARTGTLKSVPPRSRLSGAGEAPSPSAHPESSPELWGSEQRSLGSLTSHAEVDGESIWLISYSDMMTLLFGFFVLLMSFSKIDVEVFENARREATEVFGGEYKQAHEVLKEEVIKKAKADGIADKVLFDDLEKGVAVTFRGSLFFASGSAELTDEAKSLLAKFIAAVHRQSYRFNVVVEGHTDDNPVKSERFPSNWELSSQRAAAVVRLFEENGFARPHLRAVGFADTIPVLPNRNAGGVVIPENQNQNRRVVIRLIRSGDMK